MLMWGEFKYRQGYEQGYNQVICETIGLLLSMQVPEDEIRTEIVKAYEIDNECFDELYERTVHENR